MKPTKNFKDILRIAFAAAGGAAGGFLGGMDGLLTALMCFMCLDYFTGVLRAAVQKQLSSAVGFKGICKKALILLLVGMAHMADSYVTGTGGALRGAVICFYLSNEGISVIENAAALGLPVPEKLKQLLKRTGEAAGGEDGGGETDEG